MNKNEYFENHIKDIMPFFNKSSKNISSIRN